MKKIVLNKRKTLYFWCAFIILLISVGVSYTVFTTSYNSSINGIDSGQISFTYIEPKNEYVVSNALPMDDDSGMNSSNYFQFNVTTNGLTNINDDIGVMIPYEVNISPVAVDSGKTALQPSQIKMYLTEVVDGVETIITYPTLLSTLGYSDYRDGAFLVGQDINVHDNNKSYISKTYRLRAWVDFNVDASNWDTPGMYQYKFKVNVNAGAGYQGQTTPLDCFTFDYNLFGLPVITGYDSNRCDAKNLVLPEYISTSKTVTKSVVETVDFKGEEAYYDAYKQKILSEKDPSVCPDWQTCLDYLGVTESEVLNVTYEDFVEEISSYIGGEIDSDRDLTMLEKWHNFGAIDYNVNTFDTDILVRERILGLDERSTIFQNKGFETVVVPDQFSFDYNSFSGNEIIKFINYDGYTPKSCFKMDNISSSSLKISEFLCDGVKNIILPATFRISQYSTNNCQNNLINAFDDDNLRKGVERSNPDEEIPSGADFMEFKQLLAGLMCLIVDKDPYAIGDWSGYEQYMLDANAITTVGTYDVPIVEIGFNSSIFNNIDSIDMRKAISINSIKNYAFKDSTIKKVFLPNSSSLSIGGEAFANTNITELVVPNNISSLSGFSNSKIRKLVFEPNSNLTSIYDFSNNQIKTLDLSNLSNLELIGNAAFKNNQIETLILPDSLTTIGNSAFSNNQIKTLDLPDGITSIEYSAFSNNQIETLILPDSLTTIENSAFSNNQIKTLDLPDGINSIGDSAFNNNPIDTITITGDAQYISNKASTVANALSSSTKTSKKLIIKGAQSINDNTFKLKKIDATVVFDNNLTSIGNQAFYNSDVKNLDFSKASNLTSIGESAFKLNSLTSIDLGNISLVSLGASAFSNNNLKNIILPTTLTSIGNSAFSNNNLKNIDFSETNNLTSIGDSTFADNSLTSIDLGNTSLVSLGSSAFSNNNLKNIIVPTTLTSIGLDAFSGSNLFDLKDTNGNFPDDACFNTNKTGAITGYHCAGAKTVTFPATVDGYEVHYLSFKSSINAETLIIPPTITSIPYRNFNLYSNDNSNLKTIVNNTGKSFAWYRIIRGSSASTETFETGVVNTSHGDVIITKD